MSEWRRIRKQTVLKLQGFMDLFHTHKNAKLILSQITKCDKLQNEPCVCVGDECVPGVSILG